MVDKTIETRPAMRCFARGLLIATVYIRAVYYRAGISFPRYSTPFKVSLNKIQAFLCKRTDSVAHLCPKRSCGEIVPVWAALADKQGLFHRNLTGLFSNQLGAQGHSFKSVPNECNERLRAMARYPMAFLSSARRFFMPVITALRNSGMRAVSIWGTPSSL